MRMENPIIPSLNKPDKSSSCKLCKICGDRAPRIYYGILACDGCKSFFRRAVRGGHVYKCRFDRNCSISKDRRTQCRHCRLQKCLKAGMKKESIQNDRDPIRYRKPQEDNTDGLTMTSLILADELVKEPSRLTLGTKILEVDSSMANTQIATLNDHHSSIKEQLLVMVTWAKSIPAFCELSQEDKVALLQAHSGEYAIIGLVRRSLHLNDVLLMGNGFLLTRDVLGVTPRIIDEIVLPFKKLNIDDTEYALLKGIVFFDPNARGLSEPGKIEALRKQAQVLFEDYVKDRQLESPGRLSDILLRLLNLQSIAVAMSAEMATLRRFGVARIDKLLRQMLLGEDVRLDSVSENGTPEDSSPSVSPPLLPQSPCMNNSGIDWQNAFQVGQISPVSESVSMSPCSGEDTYESL